MRIMAYKRQALPITIMVLALLGSTLAAKQNKPDSLPSDSAEVIRAVAPEKLAQYLIAAPPFEVILRGKPLVFTGEGAGQFLAGREGLTAAVDCHYDRDVDILTWQIHLANTTDKVIENIKINPLNVRFQVDPAEVLPRVRYLTGSYHFDACYPPRAFQIYERVFTTHDHAKPVRIDGDRWSAFAYVPILQFALGADTDMAGMFMGFEWSAGWYLESGWEAPAFTGEPLSPFKISGNMELGRLRLAPGGQLDIPRVHMGFFQGNSWTILDNKIKRYVYDKLAPRLSSRKTPFNAVSYDHWFGIHHRYDMAKIRQQVARAAEIGCEYFCIDASWYGAGAYGSSGTGRWDQPDPAKFPNGSADMKTLSDYVRSFGMGFGIWHEIQDTNGGPASDDYPDLVRDRVEASTAQPYHLLKLETPEGRKLALDTLRRWIRDWNITWMRWETPGSGDLAYMQGLYEIMDTLRREFPDCYIEGCYWGGTRLDLGMVVRTDGTWLSDHTANRDVCRFAQMGALRIWPSYLLNMAVPTYPQDGDNPTLPHNLLSRMPGTLSFNGNIAQWSGAATERVKHYVTVYKQIRDFQSQPCFFPLPQPQSTRDWDAVVFGDGSGPKQLLYVFRMEGPDQVVLKDIPGAGSWEQLLGCANAKISNAGQITTVSLDRYSSALFIR